MTQQHLRIGHSVQTDDGDICLNLGDGDTIFDLVASGSNGRVVAVHLDYHRGTELLRNAGTIRIAFGTGGAEERVVPTVGGVADRGQPEGLIMLMVPARSAVSAMTVDDSCGARTTLTLGVSATDSLIVGLTTVLSQL